MNASFIRFLKYVGLGAIGAAATQRADAYAPASIPTSGGVLDHGAGDIGQSNLGAFLAVIRLGESSNNYRALVGGGFFSDFSTHPARTARNPFKGIPVDNGRNFSTAAGAYQITGRTFDDLVKQFGFSDFSPTSQDAMAVRLLMRRDAYDAVLAGDIELAHSRLGNEWQIFKTARFNVANTVSHFNNYGGFLA